MPASVRLSASTNMAARSQPAWLSAPPMGAMPRRGDGFGDAAGDVVRTIRGADVAVDVPGEELVGRRARRLRRGRADGDEASVVDRAVGARHRQPLDGVHGATGGGTGEEREAGEGEAEPHEDHSVLAVSLRRGASIRGGRRRASVHHGRAATAARAAC